MPLPRACCAILRRPAVFVVLLPVRVYSSSSAFPDRLFNVSPFYACPLPSKIGERFCDKLGGKADSGEVVKARNSFGEEGIGTLLSAPVLSTKDSVGLSKLVGVFVFVIAHG